MKISIITVCYNSAKTIEATIQSVLSQSYPHIEYIIIDGGSTDGTLDIIAQYQNRIAIVKSESDNGIYYAMNKGLVAATGNVIGILNSDDFYKDVHVIEKIATCFEGRNSDMCYGDLVYIGRDDSAKEVRLWRAGEYEKGKLQEGWVPPHPTVFVRTEMYKKYGVFNTDFAIAADYELLLRFLLKGVKVVYIQEVLVCMREGGHSASSIFQRMRGWKEIQRAWTINSMDVPRLVIVKRIVRKISQYSI
jgi:glycosyltransferase involved in cell wall biosynthesis